MKPLDALRFKPSDFAARILLVLCVSGRLSSQSSAPELLLEEALYQELALAESARALESYQAILKLPSPPPRVAGQAHLRLGLAHHWRGDETEARKHFQTVAEDYASETDLARVARHYLGQPVLDDPAVFMPADMLFYVELVDPRENIRGLSAVLAGTPFQNPVDYYVSSLARLEARTDDTPAKPEPPRKSIPNEAAYLNEGFLREIQLVEALAIGVPGDGNPEDDFLAVLDPGASNILRGLVQMGLTISRSEPVGSVSDTPVFRLPATKEAAGAAPESCLHLALGRDCILLGRPRRVVEESLERGAGRRPSLADSADFQRAKAARQGGIFYSYLGRDRVLAALRGTTKAEDRSVFDAVVEALGIVRFDSMGATLSSLGTQDSLRLEARSRVQSKDFPLWKALSAPPLSPGALRLVPPRTLGFFATRFDQAPARLDAAFDAVLPLIELARRAGDSTPAEKFKELREFISGDAARPFLEALDGMVLGVGVPSNESDVPPLFATFELHAGANGGELLERLVTALFQKFLQNAASRSFQSETLVSGGRKLEVRYLEPLPGLRLRYRTLGALTIISLSSEMMFEAELAHSSGQPSELAEAVLGSGKLLVLNPRAILQNAGPEVNLPKGLQLMLGEVERVALVAREDRDVVALDVLVPNLAATTRSILQRAAEAMTRKQSK